MGRLSTHVLDTASGKPAVGVRIDVSIPERDVTADYHTNADGRAFLLDGVPLPVGTYRLEFRVGDYFRRLGSADAGQFLDVVPVVFIVGDAEGHYHVPLLVSPWAYSTYRGS